MFLISRIRAETPSQELFIYMKSSCEGIFCVAEEDIVPLPGRVSGPAAGSRKSEDPAEEKCLSVRPGRGKARSRPKRSACQYGRGGEKRDPGRREVPVSTAGSRKSEDPAEEIKKVYYFCRTCDISFNLLKNF